MGLMVMDFKILIKNDHQSSNSEYILLCYITHTIDQVLVFS